MRLRRLRLLLPVLALAAFGGALSSCGGGDEGASTEGTGIPSEFKAPTSASDSAQTGGDLTVLNEGDIDYMDPGAAYYQVTYVITLATQRGLMGWPPDATQPAPDLAEDDPEVSDDNTTITFTLRDGVKYAPPVNREVTSEDVKYAIERSLLPGVPNGYTSSYLGDLEGFSQAEAAVKKNKTTAPDISGIETPDDKTIVFNLTEPTATPVIQALSLPVSAPVPEEYAKKFDAEAPSTYGTYVVGTGPYMVQNDCNVEVDPETHEATATNEDCSGKLTGYTSGKEIDLVRNPNWDSSTDYRPAYLDTVTWEEGFADPTSASQKILDGSGQVSGDFPPSKPIVQEVATGNKYDKSQMVAVPSGGNRYIALNNQEPPFDDINVRKAVLANSDRTALRNTRGGELFGPVASHLVPPLIPGFEEAGGVEGPDLDFLKNPDGDPDLAADYMKKAGFSSGKCEGSDCDITMVGDDAPPGKDTATVFQDQLEQLGFDVSFQPVAHDIMYTKFCSVPDSEPNVCPNVGWIKDFNDPQSILQITFSGDAINPSNNSNWAQFDDPKINAAIDKATQINDLDQRAEEWGKIDDMIMEQAPVVPWIWDNDVLVRSPDVDGVANLFNGEWDLSYTSLSSD